jgi:hypothetical protein
VLKSEQETIVRWDQEERVLHLYTAYAPEARKWERRGYSVEVCGRTAAGEPREWRARAPIDALRLRRLEEGKVVMRRRGRSFGLRDRKLAASEHRISF